MSYQATAVTNALAFRLKGYTNAVQESVAKKLYHWGKKYIPRDLEPNGTKRKTTRTRGKTRRLRTEDPRKIWSNPATGGDGFWHIADRGGVFLRGKKIMGPNFRGKMISVKEGSIAMVYSNMKKQTRRNGSTRMFNYAQAPTPKRAENIKTFLDQRLTMSEIKIMINESLRECSNKL